MKRHLFPAALFATFIASSIVHAQDTTQTPVGQRQGGGFGPGGQRGGGFGPPENQTRQAYEDALISGNRVTRLSTVTTVTVTSPWWSNANMVARLGLTDVQKSKIESTFEAHRQNLTARKDQLEKEEAQLSRLLDAESIDRGAVFTQINRVIQARGEMERVNSTMTLEMREQLTRAQWTQLQAAQPTLRYLTSTELPLITQPAQPGARGARGGGARGPAPAQQ